LHIILNVVVVVNFGLIRKSVLAAKSLDVILFYQTQCPEYGSHVESHDEPVLREEVLTIKMYDLWRADNERKQK
jgi:hypothetical protein